ncbi:hypothetical protein AAGS61_03050 [Lysinibacillus sp. KU-BSD001]|uniref:hypothetical protein n=1 Tax=Lysinibacillus sp. KU-BSD001 TaxID=3141328 RepID=UPI0036EC307A
MIKKNIISEIIKPNISGEELFQVIKSFAQESTNFIPVLSSLMNWVDHRNFKIRIEEHEEKIKKIFLSIPEDKFEFIFTKVTPLVFEKIIKDHEDDKVDLLLNGFENCVENDVTDYDEILYYFDMISSLRVYEIKRLFSYYNINEEEPVEIINHTSKGMLLKAADRKLNDLNLVKFGSSTDWQSFGDGLDHLNIYKEDDDRLIRSKIEKTFTGNKLIEFIGYSNI